MFKFLRLLMKYYIVIGHKKGEKIEEFNYNSPSYDCDWIEMIERDDPYSPQDLPPGAHQLFGFLDVNFRESVQYGLRATKTQEAWLIGRHRIARMLDFGNFGYQFIRSDNTKRIQFPDRITLSFDKAIKDNNVNRPLFDHQRVDIELTALNEQLINCYDKECDIDPIVFKLAKFDNYGDAYIDLQSIDSYQDFNLHINHFVHFMKNYPNSNIFLVCRREHEQEIKSLLRNLIKTEHLTNYFEFCDPNFDRRRPGYSYLKSGTPNSEYDTFSETIEEFFNENVFNSSQNNERNFFNVPFKKAKITVNNNWPLYADSEKFIKFLQYNPAITLEVAGVIDAQYVIQFIRNNKIKANIVLTNAPNNEEIKEAIAQNRKDDLQAVINHHGYDVLESPTQEEEENEDYRLTLEKYVPQKLNLANVQNQNVDLQVGQNQNQNQNQNQSQQLRQSNNAPYEPPKLEINNKLSIPDVDFAVQHELLKSLTGLSFENNENAPQTETNINHIFAMMERIIQDSPASRDCYCPLSYSVEELVPGAFYVPKEKIKDIPHPRTLNSERNTLFFSPPYASIAIKKDKYAFKPYQRPTDSNDIGLSFGLATGIRRDKYIDGLMSDLIGKRQKLTLLLNKLYVKRGQFGIDLLIKSLYSLKSKNPVIYQSLVQHYLLTSNDFSEYVDDARYMATFEVLAKLKDKKKIDWWNKLLQIQCRSNPNFDLNHLVKQFASFWTDIDKLQKFIPMPDQFPLDDFADAGITLGKMYRIMIKARNRFEQIKSFEGGNISHAYMLFDLFNSSMYCKEMNDYCASLTKQLKAEDAFDKSKLKETYFSTKKLVELTEDVTIASDLLKSYLFIYAAVNGNTEKHNNSDLAFYKALFKAVDEAVQDKHYSDTEKKMLYSTIMLFASYGNNTTKDRMVQDVRVFINQRDLIACCQGILGAHKNHHVSQFFSAQESNGKMTNSEAMPSFHTIATLVQKTPFYKEIIQQSTDLIIKNKSLSQAAQKIMRDDPARLECFYAQPSYLANPYNEKERSIQSIFLIVVMLNHNFNNLCSQEEYEQFARTIRALDITRLNDLNQLFLDIDFSKFPENSLLFAGKNLSVEFCSKISRAQSLDDLIFALQDYNVQMATIKASEQGLVARIKQLENNLWSEVNKGLYVTNYRELIVVRLRKALGNTEPVALFSHQFLQKIDSSYSPQSLKMSFEALTQIIDITKKDDLFEILGVLQQFSIGRDSEHSIDPAFLLNVTALLLKNVYPIENILNLLDAIKENHSQNANEKLLYLQRIFKEVTQEPTCYENNDLKKKLNKETAKQIKSCMELLKTIDIVDAAQLDDLFTGRSSLTIQQYLQFVDVLASPTNIGSEVITKSFTTINKALLNALQNYPNSFSDLLDIATFDAELLARLTFNNRNELSLVAKICKNEVLLNSRNTEEPAEHYKQEFARNLDVLLSKELDLDKFYSKSQLARPAASVLVQLLNHYHDNVDKAFHHYEKDPWFKRPHKKSDMFGNNRVADKTLAYQTGFFDMSKQNDVLDQITRNDSGFEKSVRRNVLFTLSTYINELGYQLPAFQHTEAGRWGNVPVRKLSDRELKDEFDHVKYELARLRGQGKNDIWQNTKYQRSVCKLLAIIREAMYRDGDKNAYSTQVDAILLAVLAGDYQYAMQINTGEGKALIATAIAIALQTITDKQIVITTSNTSLAVRDSGIYNQFIQWFGISHSSVSATTKDKSKLNTKIIHTTGNDFALCHGKDVIINNNNRIYLNDEFDYTMSHLMPSINSQSKPNEEENWWIYEEILAYVVAMDTKEAKRKSGQQVQGLIVKLIQKFSDNIHEIERELAHRLHEIAQNADHKSPEEQMATKEAVEKECNERIDFYAKRVATLNQPETEEKFDTLIDSAIVAQFVLRKGTAYEVIEQFEDGKSFKKVVPTEGGKPITEGDVMYMYGIHQFLIQKTIMEYRSVGDNSEFLRPSELESTTYFNNYSIQAGSKSIGITGTVPKEKYKMYEALLGSGKSDVIPPHQVSQRVDSVPYESLKDIKIGNDHVCRTEEQLIDRLVQQIKAHDGPALVYCSDKNVCETRRDALIKQLRAHGYTVQMIIPGVTEDFTDGDKITTAGRLAQNPKTVTLTVGDARGIDIKPKGKNGLLVMGSFVPETLEKLLQLYGRAGRNGQQGKTNLFILESELTRYGIKFNNLDEAFNFMDQIRHKEFNFAIKKIGFMQYEIQKQVRDEEKRITMIVYMDDLYNKLLLKAVADKVKNKQGNLVGGYRVSGRWEPFVMLSDEELEHIYQEFCRSTKEKLDDLQLYNIDIEDIQGLQGEHQQKAKLAVKQEDSAKKGIKTESIREKIEKHVEKQERKLTAGRENTVELADGIEVDITDSSVRDTYNQFELNLSRFDKTISLMQKYIATHIGIYGFINEDIFVPYKQMYQILEQQKQAIKQYKQVETDKFYEYLLSTDLSHAISLLIQDINSGSNQHQAMITTYLQNAERYHNMIRPGDTELGKVTEMLLGYYKNNSLISRDNFYALYDLQAELDREIEQNKETIKDRRWAITSQCQELYQELQDKIYTQGARPLSTLADRPMKENDSRLAALFSMLQMVTKEERQSEPVKRIISDISKDVSPLVDEYNEQVRKYKEIIKKQRVCLESLKQSHNTRDKMHKYDEMVSFDDIASNNIVVFYHDYNNAPETLHALNDDIRKEQLYLTQLEEEIERRRLEEERRQQEERNRRDRYVAMVRNKISSALNVLRARINQIDHPLEEAITVANDLLIQLEKQQNTYLVKLQLGLDELDLSIIDFKNAPSINEIDNAYIQACEGLINDDDTRQVLERDLNWGPFLNNLLKTIVNAIILVVTFGQVSNFFTLEKSETILTIDEAQYSLKPTIQ